VYPAGGPVIDTVALLPEAVLASWPHLFCHAKLVVEVEFAENQFPNPKPEDFVKATE
jgi:hypothetical protein